MVTDSMSHERRKGATGNGRIQVAGEGNGAQGEETRDDERKPSEMPSLHNYT